MATAEELRRMREEQSVFSALYDLVNQQNAQLAAEGRRPVLGGLLSKEPVQGVDTIRYEGIGNMLAGLLAPAAKAFDAPMAAAQGNIPREDMVGEALGTAGMAMLGGGAVPLPKGAVGANRLRVYHGTDANISQLDPSYGKTARDLYTTPIMEDASKYGKNILEFDVEGRIGNFLPDNRGIAETKLLKQAYSDYGLNDYFDSFDDFVEAFDSGDMYQRFGNSYAQDEVVGALIDAGGFDAIRIPDAGFGGSMSESVVAQNPNVFKPVMANASKSAGAIALPAARNEAEAMAKQILEMRAAGRARGVTDEMMAQADPQYMFNNTPLPMDYESRMRRAISQGFDVNDEMYRGDAPRQSFETGRGQRDKIGVTMSTRPDVAASYIPPRGEGGIYPLVSRGQNDALIEAGGQNWNVIMPDTPVSFQGEQSLLSDYLPVEDYFEPYDVIGGTAFFDTNDLSRIYQGYGADRIRFNDLVDRGGSAKYYGPESSMPSDVQMVADPRNVRSRFARFDPEFSHLANLTAANASPIGGILAQSGVSSEQAQRIEDYLRKTGLLQ